MAETADLQKLRYLGLYPDNFKICTPNDKTGEMELAWEAQPGMQQRLFALASDTWEPWRIANNFPAKGAEEILIGGRRGGGKTVAAIAWLAEPISNPRYAGLLLRYSSEALKETLAKCDALYSKMGGRSSERPPIFKFPSGAKIYTGHFRDIRSLEDVRGNEYARIVIEEACQIGDPELYLRLLGSLRTDSGVHPRILLTANPDGPGNGWVKSRFVKVIGYTGKVMDTKKMFRIQTNAEGERSKIRLYIPGGRTDNPALEKANPDYWRQLAELPEHIRKAWVDGDWDAGLSLFFPEFRPDGPINELEATKYPNARHVVPAHTLPPWCHRWAAMDLGYSHHTAAGWAAVGPDKRMHVYREMVKRKESAEAMGAEFARRTIEDLEGLEEKHINLWLSHEAFAQTPKGQRTMADDVKAGIESILGPNSAFVMRTLDEDHEAADPEQALANMLARRRELGEQLRITIQRVKIGKGVRAAGFSMIRTLLRFKKFSENVEPNQEYLEELRKLPNGESKAAKYLEMFAEQDKYPLPRLLIHDCCPILVETIPKARPDPDDPESVEKFHSSDSSVGDDPLDMLRSLAMAFKDIENQKPRAVQLVEEIERFCGPNATLFDKTMAYHAAERKIKKPAPLEISIPRESHTPGTFLEGVDLWV